MPIAACGSRPAYTIRRRAGRPRYVSHPGHEPAARRGARAAARTPDHRGGHRSRPAPGAARPLSRDDDAAALGRDRRRRRPRPGDAPATARGPRRGPQEHVGARDGEGQAHRHRPAGRRRRDHGHGAVRAGRLGLPRGPGRSGTLPARPAHGRPDPRDRRLRGRDAGLDVELEFRESAAKNPKRGGRPLRPSPAPRDLRPTRWLWCRSQRVSSRGVRAEGGNVGLAARTARRAGDGCHRRRRRQRRGALRRARTALETAAPDMDPATPAP